MIEIVAIQVKLVYVYIFELTLALIPIAYSKIADQDLRCYGLKVTKKLFVHGMGLCLVVGIFLSLISSPISFTFGWIFLSLLLAPICEEFFFRGFVQTHLMEKLKGGKELLKFYLSHGLILTASIFGAAHLLDILLLNLSLANALINAIFALIFGILIGYIYQETRSILTPILMHSCLNGLPLMMPLF